MKKNTPDPIIKQLSDALKKELGEVIKDIILFGSRASVILSISEESRPFATLRVTASWGGKSAPPEVDGSA